MPILAILLNFSYGIKIRGRKNLKKLNNQGFISISNHVHILDCAMIAIALNSRKVTFTSLSSNFDIPVAGHIIKALGVIPTPMDYYQTQLFLNNCKKITSSKKILHIYPEGHLVPYYNGLRSFNKGAFKIAYKNNVPLLPIVFSFRKRKCLYKLWLGEKPCININIGKPIYTNNELPNNKREENLKNTAISIMNELYIENNELIIEKNNTLERMSKLEAQELLFKLLATLDENQLKLLNQSDIKKAQNNKLKKDKLLILIYNINKIKGDIN